MSKQIKYLYLITRKNEPYNICDDYMEIVVCALNEEEAQKIFPNKNVKVDENGNFYCDESYMNYAWEENIKNLVVKKIGVAEDDIELNSTVISSFVAG